MIHNENPNSPMGDVPVSIFNVPNTTCLTIMAASNVNITSDNPSYTTFIRNPIKTPLSSQTSHPSSPPLTSTNINCTKMSMLRIALVLVQAFANQVACTPPNPTPSKGRYHTDEIYILRIAPFIFKVRVQKTVQPNQHRLY